MKLNTQPGLIALETKREIHEMGDLHSYFWEFFDATDYESHLLGNEEVFRTVISNGIYSGIWAENHVYQLELNRRLIDMAWLYLECLENGEGGAVESGPPAIAYAPKFHYHHESTYYFDEHSGVHVDQEGRPDPFAVKKDYKEVIARFKGKVRWLTLDEILHPHWLYEQVFERHTYPQWLAVLDTWGEYTLVNRSICEKLDGGDVYDTFVLFQKLTEMAYLMHEYEMYIPKTSSVRYFDHEEYPAFLDVDSIIEPHLALHRVFLDVNATELKREFNWWMDMAIQTEKTFANNTAQRLHSVFLKTIRLLEASWMIKHAKTQQAETSLSEAFLKPETQTIKSEGNIAGFSLDEEEHGTPMLVLNWAFSRRRIGYYREDLLECHEAAVQRRKWHVKPEAIDELRARVGKIIEAAYLIHSAQYEKK